jgi:hypothetical protein
MRFNVLPNVTIEYLLLHGPFGDTRIERFLFKIETVFAIEIADRANWLGHYVKIRSVHLHLIGIGRELPGDEVRASGRQYNTDYSSAVNGSQAGMRCSPR